MTLDFVKIIETPGRSGVIEISPDFQLVHSKTLMIRGGDFYAVWLEDQQRWSTDELDLIKMIDAYCEEYAAEKRKNNPEMAYKVKRMISGNTRIINKFRDYCKNQARDNFHQLDEELMFANSNPTRNSYSSKSLPYPLIKGSHDAWDELVSTLYAPEERHKIEWSIGAVVSGDSKTIQKFAVFYGAGGTGKSTILNIIEKLFDGYTAIFVAKALASNGSDFALEAFKNNPLVAIQHDGDLSGIKDNTRLNSLISHEKMLVNEKYTKQYPMSFKAFLFMGTNKPVEITDAKSGIIRRLIDIRPTGNTIPNDRYNVLLDQINFELGAIAYHCREVYLNSKHFYDDYIPRLMIKSTNDFYNFIDENYFILEEKDEISLTVGWEMYKDYCNKANVPLVKRTVFQEELKNYFKHFYDKYTDKTGKHYRNYYVGFAGDKFDSKPAKPQNESWLILQEQDSIIDNVLSKCPAQYANDSGTPLLSWDLVTTTLSDLDTSNVHYVRPPQNLIVIDFDIKNENGEKDFEANVKAAEKFPKTYTEVSKSGGGLHLHYIYDGDVDKLSCNYDKDIEIKIFRGKQALRRRRSKCNNLPIAHIASGLPLRKEEPTLNFTCFENEQHLLKQIKKRMRKEGGLSTQQTMSLIKDDFDKAYESGLDYNLADKLYETLFRFALGSTNHSKECLEMLYKIKLKGKPAEERQNAEHAEFVKEDYNDDRLVFFDIEVFPNLLLVCWKYEGQNEPVHDMFNPTAEQVDDFRKKKIIGFNNIEYDNQVLYGRMLGNSIYDCFRHSVSIINNEHGSKFYEAKNLSYTDVFDFSSKKQSLKKFEIELGIHHQELNFKWDEPVAEEYWPVVADYCHNDVIATEAVFNSRKTDWKTRQILAKITGMPVNTTTNNLTARLLFGDEKNPQKWFNYRFLGEPIEPEVDIKTIFSDNGLVYQNYFDKYTQFDAEGRPHFPGYTFKDGKSVYRDIEVGEGGRVYAEPGMYTYTPVLDIASMHPTTIEKEVLFGKIFTKRYTDLKYARIDIKHKDYETAKTRLNGALSEFLNDPEEAEALSTALKLPINMVYGMTSAKFKNAFKDPRNVDNIVAKRGALFMINLQFEVQKRGYTVVHIKTDSIKIDNADKEIIDFVMEYGKLYGYTFEHECTYEKMCLVNDAVYVAKYASDEECLKRYGYIPSKQKAGKWTATGTQFQVPYVFKKLFSKEPITLEDMCEVKSVSSPATMFFDFNEGLNEDEHNYQFIGRVGAFCPVKNGTGGAQLLRLSGDKYSCVVGTKGYRWREYETVKMKNIEDQIDETYYASLVDKAVSTISKYGDFEWFRA